MGLLGLLILVAIAWTFLRFWLYRAEANEAPEGARDPANPYSPPAARLVDAPPPEEPVAPIDPEFARRLRGAMEGIGEVLPLGAQPGWNFGPPPPPAELEPPEDPHRVSLDEAELARLRGPDSQEN